MKQPDPHYERVTLEQIHNADKCLWRCLAAKTRDGIRCNTDGTLPLDKAMAEAFVDPKLILLLLNRPSAPPSSSGNKRGRSPDKADKGSDASMRAEIDQLKQALKRARQDNDMGRGGGKKGEKLGNKWGRSASSRRARGCAKGHHWPARAFATTT